MPAKSGAYVEYIVELLAPLAVTARAMFGGHGLYRNGLAFAIIADEQLYFKTDASNQPDFETAGSEPFTYESRGKVVRLSYWLVPPELLDDQDALCTWAEKAYNVAQNKLPPAKTNKRKKK